MKKTGLILRVILLSVFLSLFSHIAAQKVTLSFQDVPFEKVLNSIRQQTGLAPVFSEQVLDLDRIVSINVTSIEVQDALAQLLTDTNVNFEIKNNRLFFTEKTVQDESPIPVKTISGTIVDHEGEAVIGASIGVIGTSIGTMTDAGGRFTLNNVPTDAVLTVSFIGYGTQQISLKGRSDFKITLQEDNKLLDEVVVIGYGSMRKKDLTGSVASVNINVFKENPNVSLMQSLQGSVPGLNVGQVNEAGATPSFSIRGQNTFSSGNTAPLLVVDGIIYKGNINDLNPSDIKSVDILKDASSAAIYGSRSANGVIIVTTLSGEAKSAKPVINFSTAYSTSTPTNALKPQNRERWLMRIKDAAWDRAYTQESGYTELDPNFNIESVWVANEIKDGYANGTDFDWWDASTQTGHTKNNFLSITGKNQGSMYYMSLGVTDQLGYIMNDEYQRYTGKINLENTITNWLKIGVHSNVTFADYSGMTPNMSNIMRMSPVTSPYSNDGSYIRFPMGQNVPNPFQPTEIDDLNKRMSLFGNLYAEVNIPFVKGLTYKVNYSHNYRTAKRFQTDPNASNYQGGAGKYNDSQYDWTLDNILTYDRTFNSIHKVQATLVAGREESEYEATTAESAGFTNLDLGYNYLEAGLTPKVSSTAWNETSLYYMVRTHYGYKNKYLGTFTFRRDGFSGFSEKNKFGLFPSAAVAWVMSEEKFMESKPLSIEYLKFRLSYGAAGNRTLGRYGTLSKVTASARDGYIFGDDGSTSIGQNVTSISNNDLKWETTLGTNIGLDFSILKNRISGNVEYYNSNTSNILYERNLPYSSGFTSVTSNIGKIHNKGVEFSINTANVKTQDFTWDMTANFSLNRNKVISIVGAWNDADGDGVEDDQIASSLFINQPLNVIYGYKITGIYQIGDDIPSGYRPGQYIVEEVPDENGKLDGLITDKDKQILGYKDPNYRFSIGNTFRYKNFSLFIFLNSIQGGKDYYMASNEPSSSFGYNDAATNANAVVWDYWTPSNPNGRYSQLVYPTKNSPYRVQSRSFVRLQNVSLSYNFDKNLLKRIGVQNLKLYISGQNLFTWTNWEGWDPETGQGITMGGSPVLKSFSVGLDLSF
jgi:TonB-linked SusC/RagA family outer membrane protein